MIMNLARNAVSNCKANSSLTNTSGPSTSKFISMAGPTETFTGLAEQQKTVCELNSGKPHN